MRFIITLITSLILLIPASGQGEWKIVNVEIDSIKVNSDYWVQPINLLDVQFIERDRGFIGAGVCGVHYSGGALLKTEDGGKTWNLIHLDAFSISSIHFVNESKGYMKGQGNLCDCCSWDTSSDGGHSWTEDNLINSSPTIIGEVRDLFFLNDSTGWAGGEQGIFKTINGGGDWYEEYFGGINSLFFIDEESGWAVGEAGFIMKYSFNNGWERITGLTSIPLDKVFFADQDNGWTSGGYSSSDGVRSIFMRTEDGGENWTKTEGLNYLINDFYFENKDHGWAVGEFGEYDEAKGVILETFNGGLNWDVVMDSLSSRPNALHFKDGIGWAVGDNGLILTNDSNFTGIKENNKLNSSNEPLFQNYPNPFYLRTTISYQLLTSSDVELNVYDISGRKVTNLVNEMQLADRYEVEWNAEGMNSGIYFCELKTGQGRQVTKMSIVR